MSERIEITIDVEELLRALERVDGRIDDVQEKLEDAVVSVEEQTQKSFNEVMGMMRVSYLMISGVSRVLGGGMTQVFSSMYMVGMSAIATYKAIAVAMAASGPAGWAQAAIMSLSLITATTSLISILAGQRELSTKIRGINMGLHGISGLIGTIGNIW